MENSVEKRQFFVASKKSIITKKTHQLADFITVIGEEASKNACLKRISLEELKLIYSQLYCAPAKSKIKKEELLSLIEKSFNGIDRALSMKP